MNKAGLRRIVSASFLFLASTASAVHAQSVSVPFPEGFIGTVGSSSNSASNIRLFSTLDIDRATFTQPSGTGQFTAQGNDIPGTLRLLFDDGTVIDVPGAINWRDTQGSTLHAFGFIPDPANPARTITYGSNGQFSLTLDATSNYGLRVIGSSQTYSDGSSVSGNAATNGLLNALNAYLASVQTSGPRITGPSGDAASAKTVDENQTTATTLTADRMVTWSIQGGADAGSFTINPTTGALTFNAAPDFETPGDSGSNNTYVVTVLATDANGYTGQQTVTVTVTDLDEVAPRITGPSGGAGSASSSTSVPEDQAAVATFAASEAATWAITGGADAGSFAINPNTGALTFLTAPDFEGPTDAGTNNVYDLIITAADMANNISSQSVAVTVTDLDEVAPVITGPTGAAGAASSTKSVNEGTLAIHTLAADETVTWSITAGADASRFAVDPSTGALTFRVAPDHEQPTDSGTDNVYDVVLAARDSANNTSTQALAVTVLDLDDTAPAIAGAATRSVPENQTAVDTYTADESVTWAVAGGADASRFTIHPSTGVLTFLVAPDHEAPTDNDADNVYEVVLEATDGVGNASQRTLAVTVDDIDEGGPVISGPSGGPGASASATSVNEGTTPVHAFSAGEPVTWALVGGDDQGRFTIDPSSGVLTFVAAPDFEQPTDVDTNNTYVLIVQAADSTGTTSRQTLTITVLDRDENAPQITGPSGGAGAAASATSVNEGVAAVHIFTASEGVTWAVTGGADQGRFTIDPATGALIFVAAPDYEVPSDAGADNVNDLVVTATDSTGNSSQQTVTVTVLDVNEDATPPAITGPSGGAGSATSANTINEGERQAATFAANEAAIWSIVGGPDAGRFTLDPSTGALTFLTTPDFEAPADADTNNAYVLVIAATDANGNMSQQTVTITVGDLTERAPPVIAGPDGTAQEQSQSIPEGRTLVATFRSDEPVTWSLANGGDASAFRIDPETGELRFVTAPDYETPTDADGDNVYIVMVVATDDDGNRDEITFTVTVEDTAAPKISGPSGQPGARASTTTVDEGTTTVATFAADEKVTWAIAGGPDAQHFGLDPSTGDLRFVTAPYFEDPTDRDRDNSYVVTISATDANGNASQQTVTVRVADVTDTPTAIFDERRDEVEAIVQDVEENHLRAAVASQQEMTRSARDRFIHGQRLHEFCRSLDGPNQPVRSALRNEEECSPLASRNDVALDADGTFEVGESGVHGAGTFFGQTGNFEGTRRRVMEGAFQLVDDGDGIETFDVFGRVAWERFPSEDVMLGAFLGGGLARSDVDRDLSGTVDKASLSFGTYIVAEPADDLYVDGFLALGAGRNGLALGDEDLELEGDYMTHSLLLGGAISGVIVREHLEIRPELAVAYGTTSFGDLDLDASAFGMTDEVTAIIDGVDYATVRFTPEVLLPLQRLSEDATLVVAPTLACEWTDGEQECGGGLRLGLRGSSRDGMTGWSVSIMADQIGDTDRTGLEAGIEHRF